jgi:hypothetical protein
MPVDMVRNDGVMNLERAVITPSSDLTIENVPRCLMDFSMQMKTLAAAR